MAGSKGTWWEKGEGNSKSQKEREGLLMAYHGGRTAILIHRDQKSCALRGCHVCWKGSWGGGCDAEIGEIYLY